MTIASRSHQHPVPDFPAIVEDCVAGQRGHFTIRFLHDQIRRRKVPVATIAARKSGIEIALRDPAQPQRQRADSRMQGDFARRQVEPLGQRLRTGQMERQEQRVRGPASKVTPAMEALLRAQLEAVSDRTLAELQQVVWSELQVSISLAQLWRALRKMDLRLKKSRSMPANKTAKKAVAAVMRGARS